jgi:hypothetical protein
VEEEVLGGWGKYHIVQWPHRLGVVQRKKDNINGTAAKWEIWQMCGFKTLTGKTECKL